MKENYLFFILILLIIFGCVFLKKEDQIREAFGGFKEGFREGQAFPFCAQRDQRRVGGGYENCCVRCLQGYSAISTRGEGCLTCGASGGGSFPPPAARAASGAACTERDVVRVNGTWRNCCVKCGQGYSATSTIGDGGRCLTCGIARPPPPPRKCSSFSCPCGYMNNGEQQCADNNCTQTQCCSRIPKETIPNCISQLSWGRNCAKCDPQGWELSTVPKNAPRKEPPPPTPQPTCGSKTVPSPPLPDCFKQVAPDCKKIPMVPIKDCKKQRDWGKSCITCEVGYKMSSDKTRCDLIPIPFCKKQEREVCLECEESYRIGETGRTCEKIPKKHIPFCTNQRDWGAYCYECGSDQSGYMVSKNKEKCIPRPISNCKDQEGIRCNKCKFGYERSDNWKSCDIVPIKDCASQNKTICVECKQGYRLGEDRRKCDLLPIENCRERYEEFRTLGGFGKSRLFSNIS